MYKIIKDGETVAMTEAPNYIRKAENGCMVLCPAAEAEGIAYNGQVFHLLGCPDLEGVETTVMLEETDTGAILTETRAGLEDADGMNVDHEYRITILELGLTADDMN